MGKALRQTLFAGLTILLPLYLTIYVLDMIIRSGDRLFEILPVSMRPPAEWLFPGSGLVFSFLLALCAGVFVRNYMGQAILRMFESWVARIPLVASIYKLFRQISQTFLSGGTNGFRGVVLVRYPSQELWTVAFVTGEPIAAISSSLSTANSSEEWINLFVPTTPNPTSGFYFIARKAETRPLSLTVEQAFKLIISGGTLGPEVDA